MLPQSSVGYKRWNGVGYWNGLLDKGSFQQMHVCKRHGIWPATASMAIKMCAKNCTIVL